MFFIYLLLLITCISFIAMIYKQKKSESFNLTNDRIQSILNDFVQMQNANQQQFTNSELLNIFRIPKSRGIYGEAWLKTLLEQVLPNQHISFQHTFSTGVICDAVILLNNDQKLAIDSKFPMENFLKMMNATNEPTNKESKKEFYRDIKTHIDTISKKYILPSENTVNFAFMYIPAEGIYYQAFIEEGNELLEYAHKNNVFIASPNTLYIYLQFVLNGLRGQGVKQNIHKIQQELHTILRNLNAFQDEYKKLKDKLDQAQKNFENGTKLFDKIKMALHNINDLSLENDHLTK